MTARMLRRSPVALLLLVLLGAMPVLAAALSAPVEVYRSPELGYLFWWDPGEWTIQAQQIESGVDWVQLGSGDTMVNIIGAVVPGLTVESCLSDRLAEIEDDSSLVRYEALHSPGSRPGPDLYYDVSGAESSLILAFDTPESSVTIAARERCVAIDPRGGMLQISEWITAEAYNTNANAEMSDPFATASVLETLTMPRSSWSFAPGQDLPDGPRFVKPRKLLGPDGEELAIITAHTFACTYWMSSPALDGNAIVVENTGLTNLVIAPDAFVEADESGNIVSSPFLQWLYPALDPTRSMVLHPGEIGIAQLNSGGRVYYLESSGNGTFLYEDIGCQGGGGAPVLIDLE